MPKTNKLSHILIDLDGTLIDSISAMFNSYLSFLDLHNHKGTRAEFNQLNGPNLKEITLYLKNKYVISDSLSVLFEQYIALVKKNYQQTSPFSDSDFFLKTINQHRISVSLVTSNSKDSAWPLLEKLNWPKYFHSFHWGSDLSHSKPNPEIYLRTLAELKLNPLCVIAVEDSLNGVESASKAQINNTFCINSNLSADDAISRGASHYFKNLQDSLNYIINKYDFT